MMKTFQLLKKMRKKNVLIRTFLLLNNNLMILKCRKRDITKTLKEEIISINKNHSMDQESQENKDEAELFQKNNLKQQEKNLWDNLHQNKENILPEKIEDIRKEIGMNKEIKVRREAIQVSKIIMKEMLISKILIKKDLANLTKRVILIRPLPDINKKVVREIWEINHNLKIQNKEMISFSQNKISDKVKSQWSKVNPKENFQKANFNRPQLILNNNHNQMSIKLNKVNKPLVTFRKMK